MRICFLLLVHTAPRHYDRLVSTLTGCGDYVVTHVDSKAEQAVFEAAAPSSEQIHYLSKRTNLKWGTWSIMGAALNLFEEARALHGDADYYWLISGDTYPVVPMTQIHRFLDENSGTEFLNYTKMPSKDKPLFRIANYRLDFDARTDKYAALNQVALRLLRRPYKKKLGGRTPFGGSNWVTLTASAVDFLLNTSRTDDPLVRLARTSSHPDEFFVQTVLCNSSFRESIEPALFWADFRGTLPNAAVLDRERLAYFQASSELSTRTYLVARKFTDESADLLDELEAGWE